MAETRTTVFPPGRYGRRRQPHASRWLPYAVAGLVIVASLGISYKLYRQYGPEEFDATVTAYRDVTDQQVVIDFVVTKPEDQPAVCVIRARDRSGAVVGRAKVPVRERGKRVEVSFTLMTTGTPVSGEAMGCSRGR